MSASATKTNGRAQARRTLARTSAAMPPFDDPEAIDGAALHNQIVRLPLDKIHRHPANRQPRAEDVAELAGSLDLDGLKEPIVVRPAPASRTNLPIGHYELISGETRVLAARQLGWETIAARIATGVSDADALRELAIANAFRRDLDVIQRAVMLKQLTAPEEAGGAGLSAAEAGKIYGLESDGGVRNAVQLLKLPATWQGRIVSREIPESAARQLVPFVAIPTLMKAFDADWKESGRCGNRSWESREGVRRRIDWIVARETRPIERGKKHGYGWQLGEHPRYFELTPELESKLQIVELPLGDRGAATRVALNAKAYDALQKPLIEQKLQQKKADGKKKGKKEVKRTPQQQAADDKRRREESDKKTAEKIAVWRHRMLRMQISEGLHVADWQVGKFLLWLIHGAQRSVNQWRSEGLYWKPFLLAAAEHAAGQHNRARFRLSSDCLFTSLLSAVDPGNDPISDVELELLLAVKFVIWPQCETALEGEGPLSPGLPQTLPILDYGVVEHMADLVGASIKAGWQHGGIERSRQRPLVQEFFELHTRAQLADVAQEIAGLGMSSNATKDEWVAALMRSHTSKQPLKLPKSIEAGATTQRNRKR